MRYANEFYNWPVLSTVALFAMNNWWLKYEFHNWFTGKLSDFMFCFFFPLYCSAMLRELTGLSKKKRISLGMIATLTPFILMKTSLSFSQWVSNIFSILLASFGGQESVNIVDSSDLIAIPMVLLSVLFMLTLNKEK